MIWGREAECAAVAVGLLYVPTQGGPDLLPPALITGFKGNVETTTM